MSRWLTLEAHWHGGLYHGFEWPPAPMRLLQALVAGQQGAGHPSLHWLERQPPPLILAEPERAPRRLTLYVPANNRKDLAALVPKHQQQRRVQAPVTYVWPIGPDDVPDAEPLIELARRLHTLGTGLDAAHLIGRLEPDPDPPPPGTLRRRWVVWPGAFLPPAGVVLRTPLPGSLESLDRIHAARLDRRLHERDPRPRVPNPPPARFGVTVYLPESERRGLVYLPLLLHEEADLQTSWRWHREDTVLVAAMLRHALMSRVGACGEAAEVRDFVAGHPQDDPDARLSYLPLPSIGHRHVDGLIRRALIAAPMALAGRLDNALDWLDNPLPLIPEGGGSPIAYAALAPELDPVFHRYTGASREWVSVTPMVLPGDYTRGHTLVEKLIRKALRESGYPEGEVEEVRASKLPWIAGAGHAHDYRRKAMAGRSYTYHVAVRFRNPVPGPLVLGRQRHHGLGLLARANPE